MTSLIDNGAPLRTAMSKVRYLQVDKNGFVATKQIPRLTQIYAGVGPVTLVPDGSHNIHISSILAGVVTINCTDYFKLAGKTIMVTVRPAATQNVVINFPLAGYPVYVKGTAAAVTSYTIAPSVNAQSVSIEFRVDGAFVTP